MPLPVVGCVLALVLLRLLLVAIPASADESGFLMVARQWHPGGSLYGDYWVDRPPLLVTLFRVPAVLGGVLALRGLGCVAAATTVVILASTGRLLGGRRVQVSCAVVAAALLASPLMGTFYVNGELLSAPFVAAGVLAGPLHPRRPARRPPAALVCGRGRRSGVRRPAGQAEHGRRGPASPARLAGGPPHAAGAGVGRGGRWRSRGRGGRRRVDARPRHLPDRGVRRDVTVPAPGRRDRGRRPGRRAGPPAEAAGA